VTPPNARRQGDILREPNFGLLTIGWDAAAPSVLAQAIDVTGKPRLEQRIDTASLRVA
jgi:hypothetical protein